ncbi:SUKH-4 family immunity protein [Streptomyces hygroscopicus]|uniref:SUKH-4 family immunity protein n=1 Tax=Streptomyces hygroscopicus TaxID=1912 RepID=UPI0033C4A4A5
MLTYEDLTAWAGAENVTRANPADVASWRIPEHQKALLVNIGVPNRTAHSQLFHQPFGAACCPQCEAEETFVKRSAGSAPSLSCSPRPTPHPWPYRARRGRRRPQGTGPPRADRRCVTAGRVQPTDARCTRPRSTPFSGSWGFA